MSHIVIATGVQREAATLGTFRQVVIPGGGDAVGLQSKLEAAADDALAIISFGLGGALDPTLRIGEWVIGERLVGSVEAVCAADWIGALQMRHPEARTGTIYSDGRLISTSSEKSAINEKYGALLVDMESSVAANVATANGLPFAILRCVSDEAAHALPPALDVAMRPDGSVDGAAMFGSIFRRPQQLPALIGSIAGFLKAERALKKRGRLIAWPNTKTRMFSAVSLVSSALEYRNSGRPGWNFDVNGDFDDQERPYRRFLELLATVSHAGRLDLPSWVENEDYIEGSLDWRGVPVRVYYETLLDFMTFWSQDRDIITDLRDEVIRLAGPAA